MNEKTCYSSRLKSTHLGEIINHQKHCLDLLNTESLMEGEMTLTINTFKFRMDLVPYTPISCSI